MTETCPICGAARWMVSDGIGAYKCGCQVDYDTGVVRKACEKKQKPVEVNGITHRWLQ